MRKYLCKKLYKFVEESFDKSKETHIMLCEKSKDLEDRNDRIFQKIILTLEFDIECIKFKLYKWFFSKTLEWTEKGEF